MFLLYEGRFPPVDVRKMDSEGQEENMQESASNRSEKNEELVLEDDPEMTVDQTWQFGTPSRLPVDMVENSSEHRLPFRLFCYGVSCRYSPALT